MEIVVIEKRVYETLIGKISLLEEKLLLLQKKSKDKKITSWLDSQEVCLMLSISPRTLQTFRDTGKISFTQIQKKVYYKSEEVEAFLERNSIKQKR